MVFTTYIEPNRQYRVIGNSITYNSVVYNALSYFTGVAGVTSFTGSGSVLQLSSVNSLSIGIKTYVDDIQGISLAIGIKSFTDDTQLLSCSIGIKLMQQPQILCAIN